MRDPVGGLEIRDRRHRFTKFRRSFVGTDAVNWILRNVRWLNGYSRRKCKHSTRELKPGGEREREVVHRVERESIESTGSDAYVGV